MLRPDFVRVEAARCLYCSLCELFVPGISAAAPVPVSREALEAMAACPSGAIVWCEAPAPRHSAGEAGSGNSGEGPSGTRQASEHAAPKGKDEL